MFQVENATWLSALMVLVPLALAAQRKQRREGQEPPRMRNKSSWKFPLLAAGLAVAAVGLTLGVRFAFKQSRDIPEPRKSPSPQGLNDLLGDAWWADMTRVCPRLAALDRSNAEPATALQVHVVTVECLNLICEHSEKLAAVRPAELKRLEPLCEQLVLRMEGQLREEARQYRFACPEEVGA
jgi:hypothetical protein